MSRDLTLTVNITAAPTTLLAQVAAAMPARSWVIMNGTTQYGVVCSAPTNFDTHWHDAASGSFNWGNRMIWNPISQTIEAMTAGYGAHDGTGGVLWARYVLSSNNCDSIPLDNVEGGNHNFEQITCNPFDGKNYLRFYNAGTIKSFTSGASPPYSSIATNPTGSNIMAPIEWWTGSIVGSGAQGLLTHVSSYGWVDFYNPLTNTWLTGTSIPGIPNSYNNVSAYSSTKNVLLFGGSNAAPTSLWRVNSDRTCIRMSDAPASINLYVTNFIADPATGNFLVHTNGRQFYELNPDGNGGLGTWTVLPSAPNGGALGTVNTNGNGSRGCGVASCPELGVTVWISDNPAPTGMCMHVYKHG
jgi:hypothetical protein